MKLKRSRLWAGRSNSYRWLLAGGLAVGVLSASAVLPEESQPSGMWAVQSIDTVKYSRDLSREKLHDASFDPVIEQQVSAIAATGATHVAIGTPYDEEFWPMMERWVAAARRHDLNIWFRGNWSGWEGWFGYEAIDRADHLRRTDQLIRQKAAWFRDGDIFTACPECENGGPGDPRRVGDVEGHRQFLIDEHHVTSSAFADIQREVASNFNSMNGDVARLIMDPTTTAALGGVVTVDHYVATPQQLVADLAELADQSGGRIVLGEFGAPILDIHGQMTDQEQSRWLAEVLRELARLPNLVGVNYWVGTGGSTELWDDAGRARSAVAVLASYFTPAWGHGEVRNKLGRPLAGVLVGDAYRQTVTGSDGRWRLPYIPREVSRLEFSKNGYVEERLHIAAPQTDVLVVMTRQDPSLSLRLWHASWAYFDRLLHGGSVL